MVGFYAVAAIVCTYPLVLHLADAMAPAPDTLLHSWILAWDIHALTTDPLHLYEANVYFPFPLSLTYSDAMLSGAIMVAPILLVSGNPVLAHNVLTLASLLIAGLGMYLLVRALTGSDIGALASGCLFGFCAARQAHLEHVNLLQFGWLPLALVFLHRAVNRRRSLDLMLLGLFTVCQALASVYLAWMMALVYVLFIAVELCSSRTPWKIGNMVRVAGALVVAGLIVLAVMWPYLRMQQIYAFSWPLDVVGDLSAVPTDYLAVTPRNVLYGGMLSRFAPGNFPSEHILFPGFVALALALIGVARRSVPVEVIRYSLVGSVAFVMSFGPFLRLDDRADGIRLPYFYALQLVPGFGVMRVPARFAFLVMLALAVLAGFGIARFSACVARRASPLVHRWMVGIVLLLTLVELVPRPQTLAPISVGAAVPPVYGWLRTQDPAAVVAEIPARGGTGFASFDYEYLSTYHWHRLVNGASGFEPPAASQIADVLDAFPDPSAVADLRSLGVRFVIVHLNQLNAPARQRLVDGEPTLTPVAVAASFGSDVVYQLAPLPDPPSLAEHARLELPAEVGRETTPAVTLTLANDATDPLFVAAPQSVGAQIEWNQAGLTSDARQDVPVFIEPNHTVQLVFPAQLSSGLTTAAAAQLTVRLGGSAQLEATQTVRFVDLPSSLDPTALSDAVERVQLPPAVRARSKVAVEVTARNTGRAAWPPDPPRTTGTRGVVGVSIRGWITTDGQLVPPSADSTAHVLWNVNPGQAALVTLETQAPATAGRYSLVLDMLSENVAWFADVNGGTRSVVPVDVQP